MSDFSPGSPDKQWWGMAHLWDLITSMDKLERPRVPTQMDSRWQPMLLCKELEALDIYLEFWGVMKPCNVPKQHWVTCIMCLSHDIPVTAQVKISPWIFLSAMLLRSVAVSWSCDTVNSLVDASYNCIVSWVQTQNPTYFSSELSSA